MAYQEIGGVRKPVSSRYVLSGDRGYGFAVGSYERGRELVIDPTLSYSTFLGGASHEFGSGIQVDASGNAYVTGFTQSPTFPTTTGAFDRTGSASNNMDAFVSKLNPAGTALVYSTFLGGSNSEWGRDIAIDTAGNAYVTGKTMSSNFPTTCGAFDRTFNVDNCPRCGIDQVDAFIAKLNPAGSGLVYSTFLGGTSPDETFGIAIDGARNAYVTGETTGNFPTTAGAFDTTASGGSDAYVAKLNAAGSALVYSTRLGGADNELPEDLAVDAAGNAIVGGSTRSADFPTTPGAFDTTQNGGAFDERFDLFVTKLNAAGSGLVSSTFIGGSKSDFGDDFALDAAGNAYLVGGTLSPDFPTTPGTFDPVFAEGARASSLKLNPTGSSLVYSTFLGDGRRFGRRAATQTATPGSRAPAAASGTTTADAFDPLLQRRRERRVRREAERDRLGAHVRELPRRLGIRGRRRRRARPGRQRLSHRPHVLRGLHHDGGRVRPYLGAATRDLLGRRVRGEDRRQRTRAAAAAAAPPPAAPALVSPADGAVSAQPVTFDWTDVAGAVSYTIQVDEISAVRRAADPERQHDRLAVHDQRAARRQLVLARAGRQLGGHAGRLVGRAHDPGAIGPPPPPPPTPGTPSLVSPANDAQVTQPFTFDWSDVGAAAWYVIEVDDASSFAAPLVWAATTTPSQLATNSLPNGTLFWRVRAFNSDGVGGPFSAVRTVRVQSTAPPPGAAPGTGAAEPGERRALLAGAADRLRLGRRRRGRDLHDPDRRLAVLLGAADRRPDPRVLPAHHEHAADEADVVARARQRRHGRRGRLVRRRGASR